MNRKKLSKKLSSLIQKVKSGWKRLESMSQSSLRGWRNLLIFLLLADLFGVIYYLKLRNIGIFLFIIIVAFMAMIMILERRKEPE